MELRGFDSYHISLGDEMRGERASLGKSLQDAENDLRIKIKMITAIEDADLTGFPNPSVIAGYVRSYARYLGMDPEDCYQRFCDESGYQSPAALMSSSGNGAAYGSLDRPAVTSGVGSEIGQSRFAAPPSQNRFQARISLGALTSTLALVALISGLSYGGYALLQDIQRVGFAPLPEAPVVVADAPKIETPAIDPAETARPRASDYAGGGVLAAMAAPSELPPVETLRRDGPISAIDPTTAGVFVKVEVPELRPVDSADDVIRLAGIGPEEPAREAEVEKKPELPRGIVLHASAPAWISVRDSANAIVWEGTLAEGQNYTLPDRVTGAVMRSGNGGGTFVLVDGIAYGPLGKPGQLVKNVSLTADDVRGTLPKAESFALTVEPATAGGEDQATARLTRE